MWNEMKWKIKIAAKSFNLQRNNKKTRQLNAAFIAYNDPLGNEKMITSFFF